MLKSNGLFRLNSRLILLSILTETSLRFHIALWKSIVQQEASSSCPKKKFFHLFSFGLKTVKFIKTVRNPTRNWSKFIKNSFVLLQTYPSGIYLNKLDQFALDVNFICLKKREFRDEYFWIFILIRIGSKKISKLYFY